MYKYGNLKIRMKKWKDKISQKVSKDKIIKLKEKDAPNHAGDEDEKKIADFKKYECSMKNAIKGMVKAIGN